MKAIYIGDDKLKEIPEMENPEAHYQRTGKLYSGDEMRQLKKQIAASKEYPISGPHNFKEGEVYEYEKDFKIEEQFWEGTSWLPTKHLVNCKVKEGTKTRTIAIPLPQEQPKETEDELIKELLCGIAGFGLFESKVSWIKDEFTITRKQQ